VRFHTNPRLADLGAGEAFEFSVHHLVEVDDPLDLFPVEMIAI
jgi:hypothetical protein